MSKITQRAREPSTWVGLGMVAGALLGIPADQVVGAAGQAQGGNWAAAITLLITGVLGMVLPEKGGKE